MRFGPALGFIVLILVAIGLAQFASQRHPGDMATVPMSERSDPTTTQPTTPSKPAASDAAKNTLSFDQARQGAVTVVMDIEGKGQITLELYPKVAPKTVEHFVGLCKKGFYNGILFHRVVLQPQPFVVQAGDPASKQ